MRRLLIILLPVILLFSFIFPSDSNSSARGIRVVTKTGDNLFLYKDYHALVVGVSDYEKWPDLPNAVKDAQEVASVLSELGFGVTLLTDPDSLELNNALRRFAHETGNEENRALLFYFAGHGETIQLADGTELGHIIPKDCPLKAQDPMDFNRRAISMKDMEVLALMVKSRHLLMMFDSCFSGSIFNLVRSAPRDIVEKSALPVRQFITAGGAGEQVPDRSVFKEVFLSGIRDEADLNLDGYVTASELGMHLQQVVVNYTRGLQHPQFGKINNPKLDKGDFIFTTPRKVAEVQESEEERQQEKTDLAAEVEKLREEREKTQLLLEQMKQVLEARLKDEEEVKRNLAEKKALEEKLRQTEKRKENDEEISRRLKEIEAGRKAMERKLQEEAAKRKALEQDLAQLRTEKDMTANKDSVQGAKSEDDRLAHIPKEMKDTGIKRVKLRSTPKELWEEDLEKMLVARNFYARYKNDSGRFPNDFVDNGDGTVTDRATGLMWDKEGSSSELLWRDVNDYISQQNRIKHLGYNDWRMPTIEELASLLQPEKNKAGLHVHELFGKKQGKCWSSDWYRSRQRYGVEFTSGKIELNISGSASTMAITSPATLSVKSVRTMR